MKKITIKLSLWTTVLLLFVYTSNAQVGIGTTSPDLSSMLDVSSTTQGMLTPRMTTAQRIGIATPADGLIVYDTTLKSFYYYNATAPGSWTLINSSVTGRTKFKRIKSIADLAAEKVGSTYVLVTDTYYEVNGTILVDFPIDLNNAYLVGLDANEDKLIRAGNIFVGSKGGTIKNLTIVATSGSVFTLSGANTENFLLRDCIIANSANVGTISGFGLVFFAVIQYSQNTTGITYDNITRLLLSNTAWFGNNLGTFEKFTGSFSLIQKQGGFCEVNGTAIGVDVSSNPTITGDAVMETVVFTGTVTSGMYVKGYSPVVYTGYNFNNSWNVRCAGIPNESDGVATGNLYYQSSSVINVTNTTAFKLPVNTNSIRLFRSAEGTGVDSENRLIYKGARRRALTVLGALSFTATSGSRYTFSLYKNGAIVTGSDVIVDVTTTNARESVSIIGTVDVVKDDYIEVYVQKTTAGTEQFLVTTYNLIFD